MKKLVLIMFVVSIAFISLLDSIQILTNNWDKAQGYPLYEQVGKEELSDTKKHYYEIKTNNPSYRSDQSYSFETETRRDSQNYVDREFATLKDENGTALWTMESSIGTSDEPGAKRGFWHSPTGITAIRDYISNNSMFWVDKQGNELNRFELMDKQIAVASYLKNGEIWLIQSKYNYYDYGELRETSNLASLIFCDRTGNVLNTIDLKYANLHNEKSLSKSEDYIMFSCYNELGIHKGRNYQSYLIKSDGTIVKEFDGYAFANGSFSEKEDIYVAFTSPSRIIDVTTGEFLASYKAHSRSAVANKEIGIVAVLDFYDLRVINYKTKQLLFHKKFDVYPMPKYVEITGNGKDVIVVTKEHLYKFRMKN